MTLSNNDGRFTNGLYYYPLGPLFDVFYKTGQNKITSIELNLVGDTIKTVTKNDSLIHYYSRFKSFSINYNSSDSTSIYSNSNRTAEAELPNSSLPINIVFLRKQKSVYLLIMSVAKANENLEPNQITDLLKN